MSASSIVYEKDGLIVHVHDVKKYGYADFNVTFMFERYQRSAFYKVQNNGLEYVVVGSFLKGDYGLYFYNHNVAEKYNVDLIHTYNEIDKAIAKRLFNV